MIFFLFLLLPSFSLADDFEEAVPLEDETSFQVQHHKDSKWKNRFYALTEYRYLRIQGGGESNIFPDLEVSAESVFRASSSFDIFADGITGYHASDERVFVHLNQTGFRWKPQENWVFAFGKERNRRSPGLVVSPSDFIHTDENLPGVREQREGVWLTRASYQLRSMTVDAFFLPISEVTEEGLPSTGRQQKMGAAVRVSTHFLGVDLGINAGNLLGSNRAGASLQALFANTWKVYGELGYAARSSVFSQQRSHPFSTLLGVEYQGISNFSARTEWIHQSAGLSDAEMVKVKIQPSLLLSANNGTSPILVRKNYLLNSLGFFEISDQFNETVTVIYSFDDQSAVLANRFEWLASSSVEVGSTISFTVGRPGNQFEFSPAEGQVTVDVQWSF